MIEILNMNKKYEMGSEKICAIDDVSLQIKRGDFISITGPSGSGKSTFMNMLGLLDIPDSGSYVLNGVEISKLPDRKLAILRNQKIGFIFQSFHLLSKLSALENVMLPLLYKGENTKSAKLLARALLEKVGLKGREHHLPTELSGGQQQRVAIARALIVNPDIILADEPTGALDSITGLEILEMLKDLNQKGQTLILITHDKNIAKEAKRKLVMTDGKLKEQEVVS